MSYLALYRKYRPQTFDEVYGQSAIVQTLRNEITSNHISHAYLFSGPRGTGKTTIAKILARALNCHNPINGNPCTTCESCNANDQGINIDIIEIDAASNNGVDNVRELIEESKYMPQYGKRKVYIIDEVHMLSTSAFNALLKTLEEPNSHVVFILATTEEHKVPSTILSRCQRFRFKNIKEDDMIANMQNILTKERPGCTWENDALIHIAKLANGALRDCLTLLDQCIAFVSNESVLTLDLVKDVLDEISQSTIETMATHIKERNIQTLFRALDEEVYKGKSYKTICEGLYEYFKNEYFNNPHVDGVIYQRYMRILGECIEKTKYTSQAKVVVEIDMIKMCTPQMETDYTSLHHRIQKLESIIEQLTNGSFIVTDSINAKEFVTLEYNSCIKKEIEVYYM